MDEASSAVPANADQVLAAFFHGEQEPLTGARLRRVLQAEADLRACVEEHAPASLSDADSSLLALERLFRSRGAAARVADPSVILEVLPAFLRDDRWYGPGPLDRRLRCSLAWRLAQQVALGMDLRGSDEYEAVRRAVQRARADIRRAAAEAAIRDLEARGIDVGLPPSALLRLRNETGG